MRSTPRCSSSRWSASASSGASSWVSIRSVSSLTRTDPCCSAVSISCLTSSVARTWSISTVMLAVLFFPGLPAEQTPYPQGSRQSSSQPKCRRTITRVMSSRQTKLELELVPDRKLVVPHHRDLRLQAPAGGDGVAMQRDELPAAALVKAHGVEVVVRRYEPGTGAAGPARLVSCSREQHGSYPLPTGQSLQ